MVSGKKNPRGVIGKVVDHSFEVSEFGLQSCLNVYFQLNNTGKSMGSLIFSLLFFYKDIFGTYKNLKVFTPLNKETKPKNKPIISHKQVGIHSVKKANIYFKIFVW